MKLLKPILSTCIVFLLLFIITMTFGQVIIRFIIPGASAPWTEEIARYSLVFLAFLSTVLVYIEHGHVFINNLVEANKLPGTVKKTLRAAALLFELIFFVILFHGGVVYLKAASKNASPVLAIPLHYVYLIVPASAICMGIFCIRDIISVFRDSGGSIGGEQ